MPLRLIGTEPTLREERIRELLGLVGLADRANHRPHELSGGEQQRVAIARALANEPALLLADEPTGQLDSQTGHGIMGLLRRLVRQRGVTAIVATHDPAMLDVADRVIELRDGVVVGDSSRRTAPPDFPAQRVARDVHPDHRHRELEGGNGTWLVGIGRTNDHRHGHS